MAISAERKRQLQISTGLLITGLVGGAVLANLGGDDLDGKAREQTARYMVGQSFDRDPFVLDKLDGPVHPATLQAAMRGAYREMGEDEPTSPSAKARAIVACATVALNEVALPSDIRTNFVVAGQFEEERNGDAADQAYGVAADGCTAALTAALPKSEVIFVPVGTS